jgi:hypothetical protein
LKEVNQMAEREFPLHRPIQFIVTSEQTVKMDLLVVRAINAKVCPKTVATDPWTIDDYKEAVAVDEFWEEVKGKLGWDESYRGAREDLIDEKFPLAGTCARFMFDLSNDNVIKTVQDAVSRIDNLEEIFNVGGSSKSAVNTIVNFGFDNNGRHRNVLVSDFAARCLGRTKPLKQLEEFLQFAFKKFDFDPSFDGWILELDLLTAIRRAIEDNEAVHKRLRFDHSPNDIPLFGVREIPIHSSSDFKWSDEKVELVNGTWFVPTVFNQGAFDAVELVVGNGQQPPQLHFYQVTRSLKHSLKTRYLVRFIQSLNRHIMSTSSAPITSFDVIFVIPERSTEAFELPNMPVFSGRETAVEDEFVGLTLPQNSADLTKTAVFKRSGEGEFN